MQRPLAMAAPVTLTLALAFLLQHQMVLSTAVIQSSCENGEARLADGNTKREGRVEVCIDGVWSAVCGKDWDDREARTLCRQLKFPNHEAVAFQNSRYGKGEKLAMAVKFICEGEESSLLECKYKTFNNIADKKCGGETAGVQCSHSPAKYTNCEEIFRADPNSSPGYYDIIKKGCSDETVYCSFEYGIGCGAGDWFPLAVLDMNNMHVPCPEGFDLFLEQGVRGCVIPFSKAPGCASVKFDPNGLKYTKICGRAIGYQDATIDAFGHVVHADEDSIDSSYVDGVSITRGDPRQHIWTYAATWNDVNLCPCEDNFIYQPAPSYVKDDYYCESGNPTTTLTTFLYPDDPLWDGCQCGENSKCCNSPDMPWFFKTFDTASDDAIEVRLCQDQDGNDERTVLNVLELYVQ